MYDIEERLSVIEYAIEDIDTLVKEKTKRRKHLTQNIQEIQDTMKISNQGMQEIEEDDNSQLKETEKHLKITEENFDNLKKAMAINVQEAYSTPNR